MVDYFIKVCKVKQQNNYQQWPAASITTVNDMKAMVSLFKCPGDSKMPTTKANLIYNMNLPWIAVRKKDHVSKRGSRQLLRSLKMRMLEVVLTRKRLVRIKVVFFMHVLCTVWFVVHNSEFFDAFLLGATSAPLSNYKINLLTYVCQHHSGSDSCFQWILPYFKSRYVNDDVNENS